MGSPSLCIDEMHTGFFISFIQKRLARDLTTIIQAEDTKKGVKEPPN
jgi:hypothetical protein